MMGFRPGTVPRVSGLAIGYLADRIWGDPQRGHPVAVFGKLAGVVEERIWADSRWRGLTYSAALVGSTAAAAFAAERAAARHPLARTALTAAVTWAALGGKSLAHEAMAVHDHLDRGNIEAARVQLTHLVGRDTRRLDETEICRAAIESVAENTSDAVVAPLLAGTVAGVPGIAAHRAINTLDAMVGHCNRRYQQFGWASARLDDVVNYVPARASALATALTAGLVGGPARDAVRVWRADAHRHPSPNAGPIEAAFAGALGIQLGGTNTYGSHIEDRHILGDGRAPARWDIPRATRLADRATALACVCAAGMTSVIGKS